MKQMRYQYRSANGIQWTKWFAYDGPEEPFQLGTKLKNEFREV